MRKKLQRFLSGMMAFVLAFTMVLASGIGKNVVKAGEYSSFTLYYYYTGSEDLYVDIWDWNGVAFGDTAVTSTSFGWNKPQAIMQSVENNSGWYYVDFEIKNASASSGFDIYAGSSSSKSYANDASKYSSMVSGDYDAYAIKESTLYTNLVDADLNLSRIIITSSAETVEAGESVNLAANIWYNGEKITNLSSPGYMVSWWVDSWNGHSDGNSDTTVGSDTEHSLQTSVSLPSVGKYYIVCDLYKVDNEGQWGNALLSNCITLTVTEPANEGAVEGDLNITKVSNLSDDFIMGMDISSVISLFESGVTFKDYDGKTIDNVTDFCKFLAENGITHIRVRVWNNPYNSNGNGYGGGNNDVAKAKEIADACRAAGIKMLVDFHCSDLWTDPSKQQAPKAWKTYSLAEKEEALKAFITASLNTIDPSKDTVAMVQVGNETTNGFIGETKVENMCALFSAGIEGVKAYNSEVKTVIHVTNPEKYNVTKWAANLDANNVNYDILATSYYPYWHGTLESLESEFEKVKDTYGKDVMVAETSYAYTLNDSDGHANTVRVGNNDDGADTKQPFNEQGQATAIRNLIDKVNSAGGLGVFYWEPAWITVGDTTGLTGEAYDQQVAANKEKWEAFGSGWASSYAAEYDAEDAGKWYGGSAVDNEAMFYPDGTPTPALHVWEYVKTGATTTDVYLNSVGTADELSQSVKIGEVTDVDEKLPSKITVSYSSGDVKENVEWNVKDVSKIDLDTSGVYTVSGTVQFSNAITKGLYQGQTNAEVTFSLNVMHANLVTDVDAAGIEDADLFTVKGTGATAAKSGEDSVSGNCLHWYSATAVTPVMTYNNSIQLEAGGYTFEATTQGAAGEQVTLQVLDENDKLLFEGKPVTLAGWKNWKTPTVTFVLSQATAVKLRVKLTIGDGGWGTLDNLYLHEKNADAEVDPLPSVPDVPSTPSTPSTPSNGDTTITSNPDGTTTETKTETVTNEAGKEVEVTTETKKDAEGNVIGSTETSVIESIAKNTTATVTVEKNASGEVTSAQAEVTKQGTSSKTGVTGTISAAVVSQITDAAGVSSVEISVNVTNVKGEIEYTIKADAEDLEAGNKLKVMAIDPKTGKYVLVNAKTYTVSKSGNVKVTLPEGATYQLLDSKEAAAVEKEILSTVKVKKTSITVETGKKTSVQMSSKLDMDNVEKITYSTSKKSVATVSKSGKVTAKNAGTVTIKAKVTLKNGKTKTVTVKVKVK